MIKVKKHAMMFIILTAGAIYVLYEDLRELFTPTLQTSKNVDLASEKPIEGYIGRKLLVVDLNTNEELLELKPDLNSFNKELNNGEKIEGKPKSLISYKNVGRDRMKKLSRRKRTAQQDDFGWKLSLNVNNNQNSPKGVSSVTSKDDLLSKSGKEKFVNMAIQMEGASHDNSFKELHQVWGSLGLFLRSLYGKNATPDENARNITVEINTEANDILPSDIPTEKPERERSPKFLLALLNFGSSKNPLEDAVTTLGNGDSIESVTSPKTDVDPNEGQISTIVPSGPNDTEAPEEDFDLPESISVEPKIFPSTETFTDFESTSSEFNTQFLEKFEKTSAGPDNFPIKITTTKSEPSFTSEQLNEFCISLLSRIHVSSKSEDHFSEEDGSGELDAMNIADKETVTGFQSLTTDVSKEVTTKSTNQRFGIWASIWNRFVGRRLVQHPIDTSLQPSTITPKQDITFEKSKDSFTDAFNLKGESSTPLSSSDSTESEFFSDEDGSALNVEDCEHFFRQMQNDAVFSKPNLLDIINNPILLSLDPSHFNFSEKRDDKQMRSIKSGSHSTDSNSESDFLFTEEMVNSSPLSSAKSTSKELIDEFLVNELLSKQPDKNLFEITVSNQDPLSTPSSIDAQGSFRRGTFDKSNIDNFITENVKDSIKTAKEIALLSDKFTTMQIESSTGILEDGLLILPEVHTRTDIASEMPSLEVSSDSNDRSFGIFGFGSGERSIEGSDGLSTQDVSEFTENRSIHPDLINFASGDSELNEAFSANGLKITSDDSVTKPNIFDVIFSVRKVNGTEFDPFVINKENNPTEGESVISSVKKPLIEFQFDPKEKPTEKQNISDLINKPATHLIPDDRTPFQNVFSERPHVELQNDSEGKFTETQNLALHSTNIPILKSLPEDQIPLKNVVDGNDDEGSRIFPALSNVFGSGDGRELSEMTTDLEINSEFSECLDCFKNKSSSLSVDNCINCGSEGNDTVPIIDENISTTINKLSNKIVPDASIDDEDCDDDYDILLNETDTFSESNKDPLEFSTVDSAKSLISSATINYEYQDNSENIDHQVPNYEYHDNSENYGYVITTLQPLEHVHIEGECNESHHDIKTEAFSASPTGATMAPGGLRFMDTLFLTGSGAGGLFGNDNGEINLVQEPDTTSFPFQTPVPSRQSRRGGRMDDVFFSIWPVEKEERASEKQSDFIQPQIASDIPILNFHDTNIYEAHQKREEGEKFNTDTLLTTPGFIQSVENSSSNLKNDTTRTFQEGSSKSVTDISTIASSSIVVPKKKFKNLPPRYCNHAGECNVTLNEGCITKEGRGVCDCRRSFVRHPETDVCEVLFVVSPSLKLPGEVFNEDLKDKRSELYQNKTRDAIDTMWLVAYQDPTLENNIADIIIAGFEEGSLVVHWELIFALSQNESIWSTFHEVEEKLKEAFKSEVVLKSAPLHLENAEFLPMSRDINPCTNKDLNYCSKDAHCIRDGDTGIFSCHCKEGYLDNSKNSQYPGETCIAACPQDYCGKNGYCEVRVNGERQCFCNGWYFGEQCNVSGTLAISCFAGANVVLIAVILAIVFFCKRRRQRTRRFYGDDDLSPHPSREMRPFGRVSPRLAASIALDELGPTQASKYKSMSTPYYMTPEIHITSPSVIGSSISYDQDSTFDITPTSVEVDVEPPKCDSTLVDMEPPKYDSVPEV